MTLHNFLSRSGVNPIGLKPFGAKHSPPGSRIQKSEGCPVARGGPPEIKIPMVKSYPNGAFSILTMMIFDVDSIAAN